MSIIYIYNLDEMQQCNAIDCEVIGTLLLVQFLVLNQSVNP